MWLQNVLDIVEIIGAVLFSIVLCAPLPLFVQVSVTEKELKLSELQKAMGLRPGPIWAVNFALNFAIYIVISGVFWAVAGGYMQFRTFSASECAPMLCAL